MIIRALKLKIATQEGDFGFFLEFDRALTIIKGSNSSGKSTVFNSILYSLGMEELIGGKNQSSLPYAVKDYFEYDDKKIPITQSEVYLEVENKLGDVRTFRRAITDQTRNAKLVEVLDGAFLTGELPLQSSFKYLHDGGSAIYEEGFHNFLEKFLGFNLPQVQNSSGKQVKLYLQAIFAALAVEQKRGWTDYIANIPHYGIRDVRVKVVEFLLGLNVFEADAKRSELNYESVEIDNAWNDSYKELLRESRTAGEGIEIQGVPLRVTSALDSDNIAVYKRVGQTKFSLSDYISQLRADYERQELEMNKLKDGVSPEVVSAIDVNSAELNRLVGLYEISVSTLAIHRSSLATNKQLAEQASEELLRNKSTLKLQKFGAEQGLYIAKEQCPTCFQYVDDSLTGGGVLTSKMSIETNIDYLDSQLKMLERQQQGIRLTIQNLEEEGEGIRQRIAKSRSILAALRSDVTSGTAGTRTLLRKQMHLESEIEKINGFDTKFDELKKRFGSLSLQLKNNQDQRLFLPKEHYSEQDTKTLNLFGKMFRANVGTFDYHSAPVGDIELDFDSLLPFLSRIELRVIREKNSESEKAIHQYRSNKNQNSMAADSSASDFVRLIWAYLIAIHQTSAHPTIKANHPGFILFDEPGQHSMATKSQHALLQMLSSSTGLQSIVAASFDDSEPVFKESTEGVKFKLIQLGEKSIGPL
ncbi:ATP-binding protein [Pseudomonas chlororaphis]